VPLSKAYKYADLILNIDPANKEAKKYLQVIMARWQKRNI
jgi:hypothetical protein